MYHQSRLRGEIAMTIIMEKRASTVMVVAMSMGRSELLLAGE